MAAAAAEDEEVMMEVEAVQSVYGDDCVVLNPFPPHLHIHLKPRTADVHSQQFVEATIELRAGLQYPSDPPYVDIIDSKGLDEIRKKHLSSCLLDKACELASSLRLVALCEEAVERLSSMNHPEGDCPLCLYPLVSEEDCISKPFMKLMSCFHCFHCECIIRWLTWIQEQNDNGGTSSSLPSPIVEDKLHVADLHKMIGSNTGNCPVCRKIFLAKDIEHVLSEVDSHGVDSDVDEQHLSEKLILCDLEMSRRQKFEAILELQQNHGGLIEPPKDNILFSRISVQDLFREATTVVDTQANDQQHTTQANREEPRPSNSSNETHETTKQQIGDGASAEPPSSTSQPRRYTGQHRNPGTRKNGKNNSRPQSKQWMRKG